ncbi:MAG: preprotein translocase subunit SecY [bacterium]|nr:preprotein translocase subunit SecY [bacterium]
MFNALVNIFKIEDLRKRVLFTLALITVFRIGAFIPIPGVDGKALASYFDVLREGTVVGFLNLFTGGAFNNFSIFALGIMPYISASIIIQLLTIVIPYLEKLSKEGEMGRKKITQFTRYGTVLLASIQSIGLSFWMRNIQAPGGVQVVFMSGIWFTILATITLTTGTIFLMWIGEQITQRGIGNGISLIIFAGIVARIPGDIYQTLRHFIEGIYNPFQLTVFIIIVILVVPAVVIMLQGQRRIPVQYAKRVVGRKIYGGQSTHIPLQINPAGVIPVIFASSILAFPTTLTTFLGGENPNPFLNTIANLFKSEGIVYSILYAGLIIFFVYFYTAVIFNPQDVADNMRKYGGFVPGIRPGKPTADYIEKILSRILFVGAIFLALIALLPHLLTHWLEITTFYFGGTSLLIMVGVDLDTMKQVESYLLMRHYEGFIKKAKLQGRI